jgi:hypothetical protein
MNHDEIQVDNHRFGPTSHLLGHHEDVRRITAVDPVLGAAYELDILIDKGKFLTTKERERMKEIIESQK